LAGNLKHGVYKYRGILKSVSGETKMFTRTVTFSLLVLPLFVGCGNNNTTTAAERTPNMIALVQLGSGDYVPLTCAQEAHAAGVLAADHCASQVMVPPAQTAAKEAVSPDAKQKWGQVYYNYYNTGYNYLNAGYNTLYYGLQPNYYQQTSFCGAFGFGGGNCFNTLGYTQSYYPSYYNSACNNYAYQYSASPWYSTYNYQYQNSGCYGTVWGI
jgi:hypothetical protein